jgi:ABC-type dipeptide/oligopeptide/nickel transport systems, permease components
MTSLLVAAFLTNALYAVLFSSSLQFIGLGNPNVTSWGRCCTGPRTTRRSRPGCRCGSSSRGCASSRWARPFALLNYAFDEIGNPALRPVRSMRKVRAQRAR